MRVHVRHGGCANRPVCGISRWFHTYYLEADNGAIDVTEEEDFIEDGYYELPDEDWTYDNTKEYGEDLIDEKDLLGSPTPRGEGQTA